MNLTTSLPSQSYFNRLAFIWSSILKAALLVGTVVACSHPVEPCPAFRQVKSSVGAILRSPESTPGTVFTNIGTGWTHSLLITDRGTVVACGENFRNYAPAVVPSGLRNVVSVGGGQYHSAALKSDGTVVVWGDNSSGQTNLPTNLSNVVAAAGGTHCLAITAPLEVSAFSLNDQGTSLEFHGYVGQRYILQSSTDLGSSLWSDVPGAVLPGSGLDTRLADTALSILSDQNLVPIAVSFACIGFSA
jgi:hypothetical protein